MVDTVLGPLETAVSWIMVMFHTVFAPVFGDNSGITWTLSIVGLVVVIRILLIPLFVKQIRSSRGLQLLQPELQAIQKKYKGKSDPESRQQQSQEMMALYRKNGTNPFASCLPILLQAPIFFALFRVLNGIATNHPRGILTDSLVKSARGADFFGATISATFMHANEVKAVGGSPMTVRVITLLLIALMSASTFTTQRQLMRKNMPATALTGTFAQQQKIMLYVFPLVFAVSGVNFPIGVLLYWLTTNLWTMGQQFYVIRRMPAPGSKAEEELEARKSARRSGRGSGGTDAEAAQEAGPVVPVPVVRQRQQPKRQARGKRQGGAPPTRPTVKPVRGGEPDGGAGGAQPRPEAS